MTFDIRSSYAGDWRYIDNITEARYTPQGGDRDEIEVVKLQPEDITKPDVAQLALSLGLTIESTVFTAWNPTADAQYREDNSIAAEIAFEPRQGDVLRVSDDEAWVIERAVKQHFSRWVIGANKERVNEPA